MAWQSLARILACASLASIVLLAARLSGWLAGCPPGPGRPGALARWLAGCDGMGRIRAGQG